MKRFILLTDEDGHMRDDIYQLVASVVLAPDDLASQRQLYWLLTDEKARYFSGPRKDYRESSVVQTLKSSFAKSDGRRYAAAILALSLLILSTEDNLEPDIAEARKVAMRVIEVNRVSNHGMFSVLHFENGSFVSRNVTPTADRTGFTRALKEFGSVAHIYAATLIYASYATPVHPYHYSDFDICQILSTAAHLEFLLEKHGSSYFPYLWSISKNLPIEAQAVPPLPIPTGLYSFIASGLPNPK
ncbi:hypothetical protein ACOI1H_01170 [Loktanella sp. DJP18]|uniref:hypothetical protein n=1 Tax=Loktanella sp. DJP18 TaxID=3409788 RepID=UPI003BB7ABEC